MEPVLQRFGDVTIQRLEKPKEPKVGPQNDSNTLAKTKESKDEASSSQEEESGDEFSLTDLSALKRGNIHDSEISIKRFKLDSGDITLEKKCDELSVNNFSETEMSDYDSESEMEESESELNSSDKHIMKGDQLEDELNSTTSFFEKLVEDPFLENAPSVAKPPTVTADASPDEDYDYDIKEKLKEMGEISFETVKKGEKPKKAEVSTENEVVVTPAKKPGVSEEDMAGERKGPNMRRNIREVMDETKLDESTLAAQRQEAERLRRVQEQQRLLRELQRQAAQEKMQHKVLSLLQGSNFSKPGPSSGTTRIGNTVLVKLPNGQTKPMTRLPKRPFDLMKVPKGAPGVPPMITPGMPLRPPMPQQLQMQQRGAANMMYHMKKPSANLTPSVSIAPVAKKLYSPLIKDEPPSDSDDSEYEDLKPPHKPRLGKDAPVTTIDISSDDDCIVVSEPEGDVDEPEDDPSNSGMHTNDEFNQPDEQGRVLVNMGHPDDEPDVFVAPQISRVIKPHQIGGVRFLYDNVVESTNRFECSTGFGCILAHSMGLGKTLQIVCFSDIFLRHTPAKTILCIMPINTLQNWMAEYNMWLPTEDGASNSPLIAHGEVRPRNFNLHVLNDSHKTLAARAKVIHAWRAGGGVLLIGYEQFRLLSLRKHPKSRRKPNPNVLPEDDKNKALFDEIHEALVKPGPDLVICDEGHRIKNSHASISQALKQMRTKRRVVLTGYPLQNNLMEYWCMVDFVRPNYLGSKTEFCNMFERPIMNGQCIDSTEADIKLMRYRAHVLHSLLVGFVQRRSHTVLQSALPQKEEYVLLVRMTTFQRNLYETFMNEVVRIQAVPNPLKAFAVCCKIWNHPDVLYNFLKKRAGGEAVDIDLEEVAASAAPPSAANEKEVKPKRTPARKKAPPRGKNGKPAASVTPYNSTSETVPSTPATFATSTSSTLTSSPVTPATSFTNTISEQPSSNFPGQNSNFNYQSQTYFEHHFDQNAQFPSSFPSNTSENVNNDQFQATYPNNTNNQSTNFNEGNFNTSNTFMNLNNSDNSMVNKNFNNFTNLSSEISLTPLGNQSQAPPPVVKRMSTIEETIDAVVNAHLEDSSASLMELGGQQQQQQQPSSNYVPNNPQEQFGPCPTPIDYNNTNQQQQQQNFNTTNYNNQNYQNYPQQQNYWQQPQQQQQQQSNFNSPNNYYNNQFNPNFTSSNANHSWIKKEDSKSGLIINNMMASPVVKSETSNDSKPKINIISDIKLPPVFNSPTGDKKINIISDIKIEPKKEDPDDIKFDIKQEISRMKAELKMDCKMDDEKPIVGNELVPKNTQLMPPIKDSKEDSGIPYDWAVELLKDYVPGCIENSAKMEILFCIIRESIALGDRLLVFSQSLITLDLIEQFLQMSVVPGDTVNWARNASYYRLDGSTSALEREKLINEFNSNPKIHLFLVSTRAGSLGINLIGANRVVVLDASWNPCHDTQAVCRVYRYGQRKPCFVYRLVVDNCLEKKIYDRQINKQGMSDRVVDECNPDAHLTLKDVSTLCWDDNKDEGEEKDWSHVKDNYIDVVLQKVLDNHGRALNKEPFQHESLLVDRKEKQLSSQEKRLAKKGYEREKQAARQPTYSMSGLVRGHRPVASVRPMQQGNERPSRWIPAEQWQRQGMTAQEMTLPLDVVIPTNQPEKGNIVLKAGQKVLVLKSPKGVYMQLESGKIVAIKTAIKVKAKPEDNHDPTKMTKPPPMPPTMKVNPSLSVIPQKRVVKPFQPGVAKFNVRSVRQNVPNLVSRIQSITPPSNAKKVQMAKTKPYQIGPELSRSLLKDNEPIPGSSSDDEHNMVPEKPLIDKFDSPTDIQKKISMLKKQISIQRVTNQVPRQQEHLSKRNESTSALEQLEQTTSSVLNDNTPFQDTLDSITSAYKDDHLLDNMDDDASVASSTEPKQQSLEHSEVSDQSDEVTYVPESVAPSGQSQYPQQPPQPPPIEPKTENSQDYNYGNNYYNYNVPPYHAPPPVPPPQNYNYPPQHPPPYDMMQYAPPQPQQPQYNYGYQGYPPPPPPQPMYPAPPPPPQHGYDYNNPPPPQPMYSGYHNPYPQQYPIPPQGMYPPPPPAPNNTAAPYPDYQQYPPMNNTPAPPSTPYYPNT